MYSHLSKREKQKRMALTRKRAINWSVQQQTIVGLKKTISEKPSQSTSTATRLQRDTAPSSMRTSYYTPLSLPEDSTNTIKAIQKTLLDLQGQREVLNITIDVLEHRLLFLQKNLNTKAQL